MVFIQPNFTFMDFKPMSWREWKLHYFPSLRVSHALDRLKKVKCELLLVDNDTEIYLPWYKKGDWRYGEPKRIKLGERIALLRIPAVKYKGKYLILDRCHRFTELKPKIVLLDYIKIPESKRKLVTDLISDFWD